MSMSLFLLITSVSLVAYSYILYPLLLKAGARFIRRREPPARTLQYPFVSVVVAAHNEAKIIEQKIENTRAFEYPTDRLELLIGSDGSTDGTDEICQRFPWVRFQRIEPRGGKANVLNTLIPRARGEIVVLSDANSIIESGALNALVRHFQDPAVGAVCGRLVLTSTRERLEDAERTYWNYESAIKELESLYHSTIGANGGIYALRKDLFAPIPTDTIIDDFLISLNVLEQGKRLVFERNAVAYEEVSKSFRDEFWRKVRIGAGNLQVLCRKGAFFVKAPPFVSFAYISHKVLRWSIPLLLIIIWICSALLSGQQPLGAFFWAYNVSLVMALIGAAGLSNNKLIKAFAYGYFINFALLVGYGRYLLGIQRVTWRRAQR